jgi:N-acetylglutamate synthase
VSDFSVCGSRAFAVRRRGDDDTSQMNEFSCKHGSMRDVDCTVRAMHLDDYVQVARLWQRSEGVGLSESDSLDGVAAFLLRNPGLSAVAESSTGEIVGAVLCGHDGRRGYLHHLAVDAAHRRRGVARRLLEYCFSGLSSAKILKCNIFVFRESPEAAAFWTHNGWHAPTWQVMQKRVDNT